MMPELAFTVLARPQPAGSKDPIRNPYTGKLGVKDANPFARGWKEAVAWAAVEARGTGWELLTGPVEVEMTFYRRYLKKHYNAAGQLKASALKAKPTTAPDVLKLARGTEDAMTGVIYRDDAQTIRLVLTKDFGLPERAEIVVRWDVQVPKAEDGQAVLDVV